MHHQSWSCTLCTFWSKQLITHPRFTVCALPKKISHLLSQVLNKTNYCHLAWWYDFVTPKSLNRCCSPNEKFWKDRWEIICFKFWVMIHKEIRIYLRRIWLKYPHQEIPFLKITNVPKHSIMDTEWKKYKIPNTNIKIARLWGPYVITLLNWTHIFNGIWQGLLFKPDIKKICAMSKYNDIILGSICFMQLVRPMLLLKSEDILT